ARGYYFMGKDNIVFHAEIWPALLFGYNGQGARDGRPGSLGELSLPSEVVSSEFLTMEGRKFSSSRQVVIYVRDFLARYDADALRYYIAVAGPETQDTDFTWSEFLNRNNGELVAAWGNLVNRSISMAAKNFGVVPEAGDLTDADRAMLERSRAAFPRVAAEFERSRFKNATNEAFDVIREANKYLAEQEPWKRKDDPERVKSILHVALQVVDDAKTLLTPVLPASSDKVHAMLGGEGAWSGMPEIQEVEDLDEPGRSYPIITGSYDGAARWESTPIRAGVPLAPPTPLFSKLDPKIVDEELARLGD
ncbi:methionine--tRNA ligase, partial [Streptosporangium sandarakinum]